MVRAPGLTAHNSTHTHTHTNTASHTHDNNYSHLHTERATGGERYTGAQPDTRTHTWTVSSTRYQLAPRTLPRQMAMSMKVCADLTFCRREAGG